MSALGLAFPAIECLKSAGRRLWRRRPRWRRSLALYFSRACSSNGQCPSKQRTNADSVYARMCSRAGVHHRRHFARFLLSLKCFISACQSGDKRSDFVPGFARHDKLTFLDLARGEIQGGRSCIDDNRKSGDAERSVEPS